MRKVFIFFMAMALFFINVSISKAYEEEVIWRFAEKHEYGDVEPTELAYISMDKNILLIHWKCAGDPESIEIYKINKKNKNSTCATKIRSYMMDDDNQRFVINNDREAMNNRRNICVRITNKKLTLDSLVFKKQKGLLINIFPKEILEQYFNRKYD